MFISAGCVLLVSAVAQDGLGAAPQVGGVEPSSAHTGEVITLDITGQGLLEPDSIYLERVGLARLVAAPPIQVSDSTLVCDLLLKGAELGLWDLVVANAAGEKDTLPQSFEVLPGLVWRDVARLNTEPSGAYAGRSRCVAVARDGDVHVVWCDTRHGVREVYYRRCEAGIWGPDERLTDDRGGVWEPSIAADASGNVHLVWQASAAGGYEVYWMRRGASGWSPPEMLDDESGFSLYPDVAADSAGRVHVVWSDNKEGEFQIYYRLWDGASWGQAARLTDTPGASLYPSIAVGYDGSVHVVWQDDWEGACQVYYKAFDGISWGTDERITAAPVSATDPCISPGPDGTVHVAWVEPSTRARRGIYYRSMSRAGWEEEQEISKGSMYSIGPSIVTDPYGTVHIVWKYAISLHPPGAIYAVRGSGRMWIQDLAVPTLPGGVRPSIATGEDGVVHLVWADSIGGESNMAYRPLPREPAPPPLVLTVSPAEAYNTFPVHAVVQGTEFLPDPEVWLENAAGGKIAGTGVTRKTPRLIECDFDLAGTSPELWGLSVRNSDMQTDLLPGAINVHDSPWTAEEVISGGSGTAITSSNNARCVVRGPNGVTHAAWQDDRDGNLEIYYRKCLGTTWLSETRLTECDGNSKSPSIVLDTGGLARILHVCWSDDRDGVAEVYYKKFYGTFWGYDTRISPNDSIQSGSPSMVLDASGRPFIFYEDRRYGARVIMCSRWKSHWIEEQISETGPGAAGPACCADGLGNVHVVWEARPDNKWYVYHRQWDGTAWGEIRQISNGSYAGVNPDCACDEAGRLMVVWASYGLKGVIKDGDDWMDLGSISSPSYMANLAADGMGGFHLVSDYYGVLYYQAYRGTWSARMRLNPGSYGRKPFVSADEDGHLIVVWTDGKDGGSSIVARRWEGDPGVAGSEVVEAGPVGFGIAHLTPNPFSVSAEIKFTLASVSDARVSISDVRGRLIWQEDLEAMAPGYHAIKWNGEDTRGRHVSPGVYFVCLTAGDKTAHAKAVLLR